MAKSNKRRDEERRSAAASRVADMQREQQAAERRRRSLIISGVVAAVIIVVVVVVIVVQSANKPGGQQASTVGGSTGNYGFLVGSPDAPAKLVAYEDFQCPVCDEFEKVDGPTIEKYVNQGKLQVEYRPVAILDRESSTNYSTRSLNAAACLRNYGTAKAFRTFHALLFANQPPEGGSGLPDSQLITYASQAMGKSDPQVATCINDQKFKGWTVSATDAFSRAGYSGTPTVLLNGKQEQLADVSTADKMKALLDAAVGAGSKSQ